MSTARAPKSDIYLMTGGEANRVLIFEEAGPLLPLASSLTPARGIVDRASILAIFFQTPPSGTIIRAGR